MAIEQSNWDVLQECNKRLSSVSCLSLFDADPGRAQRFSRQLGGLFVDYSRHRIDAGALSALHRLAADADLELGRQALADGLLINTSEHRAARHMQLRGAERQPTLSRLAPIVTRLEQGQWRGATGQVINCLVNIGIGGSDLGPRLVVEALGRASSRGIQVEFLANLDGESVERLLSRLDPARTAFCITTKSFATEETIINARSARDWLQQHLGARVDPHLLAITARADRAREFGVPEGNILPLADEIGGRFSLWSCVGLPIAAALGMAAFEELLDGAAAMDQHFLTAPLNDNLPVTLALLNIWCRNVLGYGSHAVVPYDCRLGLLVPYLQQLDMESNGKRVDRQGRPLDRPSAAVCWGGEGTNSQHAFFQWLHQSTDTVPVDLLAVRKPDHDRHEHHRRLLANLVGQATALMHGRSRHVTEQDLLASGLSAEQAAELAPHCEFPGNRPSTVFLLEQLSPQNLGGLLALHEHRVFCQGWIWGINPFDQWGVELGKVQAAEFHRALLGQSDQAPPDAAAAQLLDRLTKD